MRVFPLWIVIVLAFIAVYFGEFFIGTLSSHQPIDEDRECVAELLSLIDEKEPSNVLFEFSTAEKEEMRYDVLHVLKATRDNFCRIPCVIIKNFKSRDRKEFKKVSNKIIQIFREVGVAIKPGRIIDYKPGFYQAIEVKQEEIESLQYNKIFRKYINFFYLDGWELSRKKPDFL